MAAATLSATVGRADDFGDDLITIVVRGHKPSSATDGTKIDQEQIGALPGGDQGSLSKVISETVPGSVQGPSGQLFFRGTYEASTQYQLDGVQLPDLATARFGQIFPVEAIDRIEVSTGALAAEYGERLGGVVNIITKSGETKSAGEAEIKYGSYNTFSPSGSYSGSAFEGKLRYFGAVIYNTTSRGFDTPQPVNPTKLDRGGEQAVHDNGQSSSEILKLDWIEGKENKWTLLALNSHRDMQLPNFPSSFSSTNSIFVNGDLYGNPPYRYVPPYTNDRQTENDTYVQASWKHTFSETASLQITPYWKGSTIALGNDLANDLAFVQNGQTYSSFSENRRLDSFGLHADLTQRLGENHRLKAGFFAENAHTTGLLSVVTATNTPGNTQAFNDSAPVSQSQEAVYLQDDYSLCKDLILNVGVRGNFTQLTLGDGEHPSDASFQPRIGLNYNVTKSTLVHAYYGRLYHNAPPEDLRIAFNSGSSTALGAYDVKSENADYYELGVAQTLSGNHVASLIGYYRSASNWLDDTEVPNTFITQPINFAKGYAQGIDASLRGPLNGHLSYFLNYSFMEAKVKGLSGGIFTQETPSNSYQNLDTAQTHTVQGGLTWKPSDGWWWTLNGLYGSGLPTSEDGAKFLPAHLTIDTSLGYEFEWEDWKFKVAGDILNLFDEAYPITISDGLVGSQYAAGRQFFVRLGAMF